MSIKHITRLGLVSLFLAWSFDQLFWQKAPGISFFIFVLMCLGAGIALTWHEHKRPAASSLFLIPAIVFFALMTFLRLEPFTLFISRSLASWGMVLLSLTWLGGQWWRYNVGDHLENTLRWIGYLLVKPVETYGTARRQGGSGEFPAGSEASPPSAMRITGRFQAKTIGSVLIGMLLALPVLLILAALLAEADPIFARQLAGLLKILNLENLAEYIIRLTYILIGAYLLCGALIYALLSSRDEKVRDAEKPRLPPFIGWVEGSTILASVNLLFAFFVVIQLRYFFGGRANIAIDGFTYSEYARRGFGELVAVAFISLLLLLSLGMFTNRSGGWPRRTFSALGIGLMGLVLVILVSAFQRLLLYEAAYGFTRIRAYTHVFMVWLGVFLLLTVIIETLGRLRYFALVTVLIGFGFGLSLTLLNVDGLIVRQNMVRAVQGERLDTAYLISLSEDAVPVLFEQFDSGRLTPAIQDDIGVVLACRMAMTEDPRSRPWPSFHWSREQAARLFQSHQVQLAEYPVRRVDGVWKVTIHGVQEACWEGRDWGD